jgi:hypothetical protein
LIWLCSKGVHPQKKSHVQGDRRAGAAGPSLSDFNFESHWGQKALKHMYRAICEVMPSIPTHVALHPGNSHLLI